MGVVALLHMDGANNDTAITDSSPAAHTYTRLGGAVLSTARSKFGATSLYCNGSTSDGFYTADHADWILAGQFTIEAWVNFVADSATCGVLTQWSGTQNAWWLGKFGGNLQFFYSLTGGDNNPISSFAWAPTLNQWYHLAVDRDASNVLRLYLDGVVKATVTVSTTFANSDGRMTVGNEQGAGTRGFPGYIDEVRITTGTAQYGGAFTPPTQAFGASSAIYQAPFFANPGVLMGR